MFNFIYCRYCGKGLKNKTLISDGSLMILTFKSDMRTSDVGFKAKIEAVPLRFGGRDRGNSADFLNSFYSVFSSNNEEIQSNSYLESVWNIFDSMSLSNILGQPDIVTDYCAAFLTMCIPLKTTQFSGILYQVVVYIFYITCNLSPIIIHF